MRPPTTNLLKQLGCFLGESRLCSIGGATVEALRLVPPQILGPRGMVYSVPPQIFSICPKTSSHFFQLYADLSQFRCLIRLSNSNSSHFL